jgi:hypothetical protein
MDKEIIANIIASIAVFVAFIIPAIQIIYGRRNEWHTACELLFRSLETLYQDINSLVENPQATNLISFQHLLMMRRILFQHYANKFILQRKRIGVAENIICDLMEIPLNTVYETILLKGTKDHGYHSKDLNKEIRNYIYKGCNYLIKQT